MESTLVHIPAIWFAFVKLAPAPAWLRWAVLATLSAGDFFGDMSLFDHGPRSADVVAETSGRLLKVSATAFDRLAKEAPELATPFLMALGKTLVSRIRAENKHHFESARLARTLE